MTSILAAMGSVARVETSTRELRTGRFYPSFAATGFFYVSSSQELYLVTNKHVVRSEEKAHFPEILTVHVPVIRSGMTRTTKRHRLRLYDRKNKRKLYQTPKDSRVDVAAIKVDTAVIKIDVNEKAGFVPLSGKDTLPK
jgi:S1-C subfamily serine protease